MRPTICAILARFNGDRKAARGYCIDISYNQAFKNKGLSSEYWMLAEEFSVSRVPHPYPFGKGN